MSTSISTTCQSFTQTINIVGDLSTIIPLYNVGNTTNNLPGMYIISMTDSSGNLIFIAQVSLFMTSSTLTGFSMYQASSSSAPIVLPTSLTPLPPYSGNTLYLDIINNLLSTFGDLTLSGVVVTTLFYPATGVLPGNNIHSIDNITENTPGAGTTFQTVALLTGGNISNGGSLSSITQLTSSDSGNTYTISQASAYTISLPTSVVPGMSFKFCLTEAGAFPVQISAGSAIISGTIITTTVIGVSLQTNIILVASTAALGDNIELWAATPTTWMVRAVSSVAGGITSS